MVQQYGNLVPIQYGEVPVIRDWESDVTQAAAALAVESVAYYMPPEVVLRELSVRDLTAPAKRFARALRRVHPDWTVGDSHGGTMDASKDIGFHGNPYNPDSDASPDMVHFHLTPLADGPLRVTFANPHPRFMDAYGITQAYMQYLLEQDYTNSLYVDPDSFRRVEVAAGGAVIFRLNHSETHLPQLHDFKTTSGTRTSIITRLYRAYNE